MVLYFDIFGTQDFHNQYSDSNNQISQNETYLENNAADTISDAAGETLSVEYKPSWTYNVDASDNNSTLGGRKDTADTWLDKNYTYYDSASVCVVFDYFPDDSNVNGVSDGGGVNTDDEKTIVVNRAGGASWTNFSFDWVSGHESGHACYAKHTDVQFSQVNNYDWKATYMHTGKNASDSCSGNPSAQDDVIEVQDYFSTDCSYREFQDHV